MGGGRGGSRPGPISKPISPWISAGRAGIAVGRARPRSPHARDRRRHGRPRRARAHRLLAAATRARDGNVAAVAREDRVGGARAHAPNARAHRAGERIRARPRAPRARGRPPDPRGARELRSPRLPPPQPRGRAGRLRGSARAGTARAKARVRGRPDPAGDRGCRRELPYPFLVALHEPLAGDPWIFQFPDIESPETEPVYVIGEEADPPVPNVIVFPFTVPWMLMVPPAFGRLIVPLRVDPDSVQVSVNVPE